MKTPIQKVFGDQPERAGRMFRFVSRKGQQAFTLLELLIVVAVIVILAGLLLPALSRSKARALAIACRNNTKQLAWAWTMYSDDNASRLAYNLGPGPNVLSGASLPQPNWVNNVMNWELTTGNTNLDFIGQSIIGDYTVRNAGVYHCPSDTALSSVQKAAGWTQRVRSYSMNAMVGDPGNLLQNGVNIFNPGYQQFIKESDFRDPSSVFVFLDEHPDSIEDGYFVNTATDLEWKHLPASYHNNGGSFAFADGHAEIHRWQCASTLCPPIPGGAPLPISLSANDTTDFDWVTKHSSSPPR
jgi:prepilin-type N-terminal cleavage/methylation domain-containing protein/prepilin-type processing-associated H-X9-DG protein